MANNDFSGMAANAKQVLAETANAPSIYEQTFGLFAKAFDQNTFGMMQATASAPKVTGDAKMAATFYDNVVAEQKTAALINDANTQSTIRLDPATPVVAMAPHRPDGSNTPTPRQNPAMKLDNV